MRDEEAKRAELDYFKVSLNCFLPLSKKHRLNVVKAGPGDVLCVNWLALTLGHREAQV